MIQTDDGTLLTFRQRIFDQYLTCIATIQKGVQQKQLFLQYTYDALNPKIASQRQKLIFSPTIVVAICMICCKCLLDMG
ncbi:MAG: hypothetical protein HC912_02675 [Saprospiraceae bacterium]|nr:hypothetical protein [Saprospiraceae bacterium]